MTADSAAKAKTSSPSANDHALAQELFDELRTQTSDGIGITRLAYSDQETAALGIIEAKAKGFGLQTARDAGANLVVTLEGEDPTLPSLALGSHLDSVPQGGNYDGAAGVVAGLMVLARLVEEGRTPKQTLKLYGLRGEESARFGKAYIGSSALFGRITAADLTAQDLSSGRTLLGCMAEVGVDVDRVKMGEPLVDAKSLAGWIELHIEQGPVLLARKTPIGIVTGIRGNVRHRMIECLGEPGHSGAVPRELRHDAVFATADLITRLDRQWEMGLERGEDLVVTCGILSTDLEEHAIARIPGKVHFSFEVRSQNVETMELFYRCFLSECEAIEREREVKFRLDRRVESLPAMMDAEWVARLKRAAVCLGLPGDEMASGAGHDAAVFANAGIPSAMLFVRNENGSHNPNEAMDIDDFVKGVAVMRAGIAEAVL
ncbi:MAG: hydantoinase/carbamoylase family amidase [Rhodomicrobium sp.]